MTWWGQKGWCPMPRLLDNLFSANPSNDKIDTSIDENLLPLWLSDIASLSMIRGSDFASEK
jgi:hypothetical protein